MTIKNPVFVGNEGDAVNTTAGGNFTAVTTPGWTYTLQSPPVAGTVGLRMVNPPGAVVVRDVIATNRVTLAGWVWFSTLPGIDWHMLHTEQSGGATSSIFMVNSAGKARLTVKGTTQTTEPGTFPTNTLVWCSLYVDAGTTATNGSARIGYYTAAGGSTALWDSGLISGLDTAGTTAQFVNVRLGKNSTGAVTTDFRAFAPSIHTGVDAVQLLPPPGNAAPSAAYSSAFQTVSAGNTFTATLTGTDADGTITAYQHEVVFPSPGGPALAGSATTTVTGTAPAAPALVKLRGFVVDNSQIQSPDAFHEIRVPGTASQFTTIPNVPESTIGTVTNVGTGVAGVLLSDTSDASYLQMPSGSSFTIRGTPIVTPASLVYVVRMSTDTGTATAKAELLQGTSSVIHASANLDLTTTITDFSLTVTNIAAITDPGALYVRITAL